MNRASAATVSARDHAIGLRLLGGFELRDGSGDVVQLAMRKAEALVALLALAGGQPVAREKLWALLWPDVREAQARHSLRQTLLSIRKASPQLIRGDARNVALDDAQVDVDLARLEAQLALGSRDALVEAAQLYRGELLEGMSVGERPFEQWLTFERERVRSSVTRGLGRLVELHAEAGELAEGIQICTQLLQLDPLHEETHRELMRLQLRQGRRASALQHYQMLVRALREELGAEPEAETQQLYGELERAAAVRGNTPVPPLEGPATEVRIRSSVLAIPAAMRGAELAQLHAARTAALSERARLCLLSGEAGVGKTHVCDRFAAEVSAAGTRVLRGRCFESEQVVPFSLWANLLGTARPSLEPGWLENLPEPSRAELACLLPELGSRAQAPRGAQDALPLFHALQTLLLQLAAAGPLMLVLEDLHWADEMSLRVLCFLARRLADAHSCFTLCSARTEETATAPFLPTAIAELEAEQLLQRVPLAPLSQRETAELASDQAAQLELDTRAPHWPHWLDQIWAISEGNPLVIVESVRALAQRALDASVEALPVPERVRALIRRRVARTSPAARELMALSAVHGRELDFEVLRDVFDEPQLWAASEEVVGLQLMRALPDSISFTHDRIRETLYAEMLPARRRYLHGRVAEALERRGAREVVLGHLGYHYAKAGNAAASIPYLIRFAEQALRGHALGEALAALEHALQGSSQLLPQERGRTAVDIMIRQAFCLAFLGRFAELVKRLEQQAANTEALEDAALAGPFHFWWGFGLTMLGERETAEQHARIALEHAQRCADRHVTGYAHGLLSSLCASQGRYGDGVRHGMLATDLLDDCHDLPEAFVIASLNLSMNHLWLGDWRQAFAEVQRAAERARAVECQRGSSMASSALAYIYVYTDRFELAKLAAQTGLETSNTPFTLVQALWITACSQLGSGESQNASVLLEQIIAQLDQHGMRAWSGVSLLALAEARLRHNDWSGARTAAHDASELARQTHDRLLLGSALRARGRAAYGLGDPVAARADVLEALLIFEAVEARIDIANALAVLGELELERGEHASGRELIERAAKLYAECDVQVPGERAAARLLQL
jgi:DNA-binding SARP family transcriptional activator